MRIDLVFACIAMGILAGSAEAFAETTNKFDLQVLARRFLPDCQLRVDGAGKPEALVGSTGEVLELATAARDHPMPINGAAGYWFSPTMDFLSRQKPKVETQAEAAGVVQLLHALCWGPAVVKQKLYAPRPFEGGWVIEVEHDFTNYLASVRAIPPYELLVDDTGRVVHFRERCYSYPGSPVVYSNTVTSVYEREISRNRGRDYPEVLFKELRTAWEKEKEQTKPVVISIAEDGALVVAGQQCSASLLPTRLAELAERKPAGIVIRAHARAPMKQATQVMEACKKAGLHLISLTAEK